jgi:hypothetical protein
MAHLAKDRQHRDQSQTLTSEGGIVDPSNAAVLLHVLHLGPTKDVTMCNWWFMAHLAKDMSNFLLQSSNTNKIYSIDNQISEPKALRYCRPIKCCCTASCPLFGFNKGCGFNVQLMIHGPFDQGQATFCSKVPFLVLRTWRSIYFEIVLWARK